MQVLFGSGVGLRAVWKEINCKTFWATWALTSIVVAIAGPFGTFDSSPFIWRLSYWGALIGSATVIAIFLRVTWRNLLAKAPEWQEDLAVAVCLALVFGPMVVVVNRILGGPEAYAALGFLPAMVCVFAIAVCTIAIRRALTGAGQVRQAEQRRDRLMSKFQPKDGVRLSRISSDNHHIRVVTNDGEEHRVLMRLRDAVAEVDVEPGMCVHRSHWVAKASIARVVQSDGRELVELVCGSHVPVGPKYRPNLIEAGVLSA